MSQLTRRTQTERRESTRVRLLDATITCLLEAGYAGTTTRRVGEIAGVSQGTLRYHFAHRLDLIVSAVEHIGETRVAEIRELAHDLPAAPRDRVAAYIDVVWADFSSPAFRVFMKLWTAAADDRQLYERLIPVERRLLRAVYDMANDFIGGALLEDTEFDKRLRVAIAACRGLALAEHFEPRATRRRDPWPDHRPLIIGALLGDG